MFTVVSVVLYNIHDSICFQNLFGPPIAYYAAYCVLIMCIYGIHHVHLLLFIFVPLALFVASEARPSLCTFTLKDSILYHDLPDSDGPCVNAERFSHWPLVGQGEIRHCVACKNQADGICLCDQSEWVGWLTDSLCGDRSSSRNRSSETVWSIRSGERWRL